MKKLLKSKRGEGYIDVCIIVLVVIMVLALFYGSRSCDDGENAA